MANTAQCSLSSLVIASRVKLALASSFLPDLLPFAAKQALLRQSQKRENKNGKGIRFGMKVGRLSATCLLHLLANRKSRMLHFWRDDQIWFTSPVSGFNVLLCHTPLLFPKTIKNTSQHCWQGAASLCQTRGWVVNWSQANTLLDAECFLFYAWKQAQQL